MKASQTSYLEQRACAKRPRSSVAKGSHTMPRVRGVLRITNRIAASFQAATSSLFTTKGRTESGTRLVTGTVKSAFTTCQIALSQC